MFNNIGKKLQTLAMIFFWIGTIGSVIVFGWMFIEVDEESIIFLPVAIIASWLSTCGLYAFGRLVENSDKLVNLAIQQNNTTAACLAAISNINAQPTVSYAPMQAAPVQAAPVQAAPVQAAPVAPVQAAPAGKVCPNCNNVGEGSFCLYCGTALN